MKVQSGTAHWFSSDGIRLDASFHLSEGRVARKSVEKSPLGTIKLSQASKRIFLGARFKRVYVNNPKNGYPYLTASNMTKLEPFSGIYLSKKHTLNIDFLKIKKDWILISCSGSIGQTVYSNDLFEGQIGTHDLIRVEPDPSIVLPGYLYAYLSSRYGYALLTKGTYGGVVQHIEPHHIEGMPVPLLPEIEQQHIHDLVENANRLRVEANNLLNEAESDFLKLNEINIDQRLLEPSENRIKIGFISKASPRFLLTLKARNYSERAFRLVELWNSTIGKPFKNWVNEDGLTRGQGGFFKRTKDVEIKGIDIISQGDIHELKPIFKKVIRKGIKESEIARTGMIIMPAAGTLGENEIFLKPQLVYKNLEGRILSEVVGKLRPNTLQEAAYLFTALNSDCGFRILRTMVYGTNLMYPRWDLLCDINIPCKDSQTLNIVSNKVIDALDKRSQAFEMENKAIALIESSISSW